MKPSLAFKHSLAVAALAVAGVASADSAPDYLLPIGSSQQISVSAPLGTPTLSFQNTFGFTVGSPSSFSGSVISSALNFSFLSIQAIGFGGVTLNPGVLTSVVSEDTHQVSFSAANLAAGDYVLTVSGTALPALTSFPMAPTAAGSYTIAANLAPVPEPESYAMFLAGLGIIGAVANRRRKSI